MRMKIYCTELGVGLNMFGAMFSIMPFTRFFLASGVRACMHASVSLSQGAVRPFGARIDKGLRHSP